jgi:phage baseplate assembly protein W
MSYGETLKLDSSGDLVFNQLNRLEMVDGAEKVAQDIRIILKTIKGSDPFYPEMGVDYFKIFESSFNKKLIEAEIRKALSRYSYLKSIDEIEVSDLDSDRKVTITLRLTVISGESVSMEVTL